MRDDRSCSGDRGGGQDNVNESDSGAIRDELKQLRVTVTQQAEKLTASERNFVSLQLEHRVQIQQLQQQVRKRKEQTQLRE